MIPLKFTSIAVSIALSIPAIASATEEQTGYAEAEVLPSATDEIGKYRRAGEWTVFENKTRKSCFMTRTDESGGAVQMGLTKSGEYGYIGIFVKGAQVEDEIKEVAIVVNGNVYVGEANPATHLEGNYQGGYILANNTKLRHDLGKGDELVAFPDAPYSVLVDLKDAGKAIFEVRKCTSELQEE